MTSFMNAPKNENGKMDELQGGKMDVESLLSQANQVLEAELCYDVAISAARFCSRLIKIKFFWSLKECNVHRCKITHNF